tara:strand:- start:21 stop:1043 length:1023 start_codon:yes stop_codon:yes gene_type:complete
MQTFPLATIRLAAILVIGIYYLGTSSTAQETPAANSDPDGQWTLTRTPWGHPDLQGIWDSKTQTPLERPEEYANREFLTAEEVTALEQGTIESKGRDERAEPGSKADVEGAYNNAYSTFYGTKVVGTGRTSLIIDPSDGKIPYTPEAKQAASDERARREATREDANDPEDRLADRCLGFTLPCTSPLCAFSRIVQTLDSVTLYYEVGHWGGNYRTIYLDGRPHSPSHIKQWHGDSRGHWEENTLVVDTTNFSVKGNVSTKLQGATESLHLTERFTRVEENLIMYQATVKDDAAFTKPWTLEMTWQKADEKANLIYESACHEGNYALTSILAGARVLEGVK